MKLTFKQFLQEQKYLEEGKKRKRKKKRALSKIQKLTRSLKTPRLIFYGGYWGGGPYSSLDTNGGDQGGVMAVMAEAVATKPFYPTVVKSVFLYV